MKIDFKKELAENLSSVCGLDPEKVYSLIEVPPDERMGDLCFPCFVLVKEYKKSPQEIAEELKRKLFDILQKKKKNYFGNIEVKAGYLNIFINQALYIKVVLQNFKNNLQFTQKKEKKDKVIIEYMNANPNKPLHLGQGRNICLGDSLVRVFRFLGYNVDAVNYGDDSGVNVAYNLTSHLYYNVPWEEKGIKFDHYCGKVYTDSLLLQEQQVEFTQKMQAVIKEVEKRGSKIARQQQKYATQCMLAQMETCWRINSFFNLNTWETDILHLDLLAEALKKIKKIRQVKLIRQGKYKNCLVFDLSGIDKYKGLKEKFCVLIKSDGTATYLVKDIAYALWKIGYLQKSFYYKKLIQQPNQTILWSTFSPLRSVTQKNNKKEKGDFGNYDLSIAVIDKRQEFLQQILIIIINQLQQNYNKEIQSQKQYFHLSYGVVYLTPTTLISCGYALTDEEKQEKRLPFSSRRGWTVTIDEILDQLENRAYQETKTRNPLESEIWLKQTSQKIAVAALRFWLSKTDKKRDVIFDINDSLKLDGDSGVYIQYSYIRIINILKKIQPQKLTKSCKVNLNYELLQQPLEFHLVKKIASCKEIIEQTKTEMSLHLLTTYLIELCHSFNRYYEECSIINSEDKVKKVRMDLITKVALTLKTGLNLLGIEEIEKM